MDKTFNFNDIIKKSFLDQFGYSNAPLTFNRIYITLLLTFIIGLFIFYVYKKTFKGVLYTHSFNIALIMVSMVTALIIMPISSNITLSLGMVGALSIVRFRTAIKDPIDVVFMFWAIAVGISTGAGFFLSAVSGTLIIGIVLLSLSLFKFKSSTPFLLILRYDNGTTLPLQELLKSYYIKSRTVTGEGAELTVEVRVKDNDTSFVNDFLKIEGVKDASLISYNGDYVS